MQKALDQGGIMEGFWQSTLVETYCLKPVLTGDFKANLLEQLKPIPHFLRN
jgi:hypothetical protein